MKAEKEVFCLRIKHIIALACNIIAYSEVGTSSGIRFNIHSQQNS